jgi:hypothetical protein
MGADLVVLKLHSAELELRSLADEGAREEEIEWLHTRDYVPSFSIRRKYC